MARHAPADVAAAIEAGGGGGGGGGGVALEHEPCDWSRDGAEAEVDTHGTEHQAAATVAAYGFVLLAVGRANYLVAGSDQGGERAAIAYTVISTAVLAGVDPLVYLPDVFR